MTPWKRVAPGVYQNTVGKCDAKVWQDGELWRSSVWYDGELRDCGEWDGRWSALKNARSAMRRAVELRSLEVIVKDDEDE